VQPQSFDCAYYLEQFMPERAPGFMEKQQVSFDLAFGLDIKGSCGGQWSCRWESGRLHVGRGLGTQSEILYRTDAATFADLVDRSESLTSAFFAGRIQIEGDMEKALFLAFIFQSFFNEVPYLPARTEAFHDSAGA
jgi:predicted lipid carrier protein YhbT